MKINPYVESIFSIGLALYQTGRLKSTIHCGENYVYILNMDNTVLIRYELNEKFPFKFSFFANDYESNRIKAMDDGSERVIFFTKSGNYKRKKVCPSTRNLFSDVNGFWKDLESEGLKKDLSVSFNREIVDLLDMDLSHVEFRKDRDSGLEILQRDIYSGALITITEDDEEGLLFEEVKGYLDPKGMRTMDFVGVFTLEKKLRFYFDNDKDFLFVEGRRGKMKGYLSLCKYDELGKIEKIKKEKKDGRKKSKDGDNK